MLLSKPRVVLVPSLFIFVLAFASACGGGDGDKSERLFAPQDNQLDVFDLTTEERTVPIPADRNTVNGQVCLLPDGSGNFLLGEDTRQAEDEGGERMGWGIFSP